MHTLLLFCATPGQGHPVYGFGHVLDVCFGQLLYVVCWQKDNIVYGCILLSEFLREA